jgi:hypothetical protein
MRCEPAVTTSHDARGRSSASSPSSPDSREFYGQMVTFRLPAGAPDDLQERLNGRGRPSSPRNVETSSDNHTSTASSVVFPPESDG